MIDNLKLENQLCFPLYAASRKVISAYTPFLKPLDLTYTQYLIMLVLWEKDGRTIGDKRKGTVFNHPSMQLCSALMTVCAICCITAQPLCAKVS